jgi:hypothetical protein
MEQLPHGVTIVGRISDAYYGLLEKGESIVQGRVTVSTTLASTAYKKSTGVE